MIDLEGMWFIVSGLCSGNAAMSRFLRKLSPPASLSIIYTKCVDLYRTSILHPGKRPITIDPMITFQSLSNSDTFIAMETEHISLLAFCNTTLSVLFVPPVLFFLYTASTRMLHHINKTNTIMNV